MLCIWFSGILAAFGAWLEFSFYSGFTESVYQYIAGGAAEVILLSVIMRLSDEPYKINAVKMYMVDYLDNICAFRLRKQSQREKEFIDVISAEANERSAFQASSDETDNGSGRTERERNSDSSRAGGRLRKRRTSADSSVLAEGDLPINIEGEPRKSERGEAARQAVRYAASDRNSERPSENIAEREADRGRNAAVERPGDRMAERAAYRSADEISAGASGKNTAAEDERPALREEAIRQILEEFLA